MIEETGQDMFIIPLLSYIHVYYRLILGLYKCTIMDILQAYVPVYYRLIYVYITGLYNVYYRLITGLYTCILQAYIMCTTDSLQAYIRVYYRLI